MSGRAQTPATRARIASQLRGRKVSEETKARMRESQWRRLFDQRLREIVYGKAAAAS